MSKNFMDEGYEAILTETPKDATLEILRDEVKVAEIVVEMMGESDIPLVTVVELRKDALHDVLVVRA